MICDLDGNSLNSGNLSIPSGGNAVLQIGIDCLTGYEFAAEAVSLLVIEARALGDSSWTSIETTPIDLSPYAGTRKTFEVRLTADAVIALQSRTAFLHVRKS